MLLAVDVGNSTTVIGVFDDAKLVQHWRSSTDPGRTADELALLFDGFLSFADLSFAAMHGVVISSVVPLVTERLREMAERYVAFEPIIVGPGIRSGIAIRYPNPTEIGADRLMNALAAYDQYGGPAVVVDFGTSTNFDVVSAKGEFIGGAIAPGVQTSMDALSARGARLPTIELAAPGSAIGRSTTEAMQSGVVYGFAGQVDRIVTEIASALPEPPRVVATGGLASAIMRQCRTIEHHDPWLTLKGLRLVWERNR